MANVMNLDEINAQLDRFPSWDLDLQEMRLFTEIELESFEQAVEFLHGIVEISNELNHHPDVFIHDYKFVTLYIKSHELNGITDQDFEFVRAVEDMFENITEEIADEEVQEELSEEGKDGNVNEEWAKSE